MKILKRLTLLTFTLFCIFAFTLKVNAASASISVSTSSSQVIVGNTFTATVKISSGSGIGTLEFTIDYDSSKFQLVSGSSFVADYGDESTYSKSYTYKFKAISSGSGSISVKSYSVLNYADTNPMSVSVGSKTVKVITQAELQASYSKDNYLSSLNVNGLALTPAFSKDVSEYSIELESSTTSVNIGGSVNDNRSSVSGLGTFDVAEGENVFNIVVTAQNGGQRTYKILVNVIDPNPVNVTIDDVNYNIVKRDALLTIPEGFEKISIKIDDIEIPALYNENNKFTLVGLRNEGNVELYVYDSEKGSYDKYYDVALKELNIFPLSMDLSLSNEYVGSTVSIDGADFDAYNLKDSNYYVIKGKDLSTGQDNYYLYDSSLGTVVTYDKHSNDASLKLNADLNMANKYLKISSVVAGTLLIIVFILLISKSNDTKKIKKLAYAYKEAAIKEGSSEEIKDRRNRRPKTENTIEIKNEVEPKIEVETKKEEIKIEKVEVKEKSKDDFNSTMSLTSEIKSLQGENSSVTSDDSLDKKKRTKRRTTTKKDA